jgi:hypothetical protein
MFSEVGLDSSLLYVRETEGGPYVDKSNNK